VEPHVTRTYRKRKDLNQNDTCTSIYVVGVTARLLYTAWSCISFQYHLLSPIAVTHPSHPILFLQLVLHIPPSPSCFYSSCYTSVPSHLVSTVGATHRSQPILFLQLVLLIPPSPSCFYSWCYTSLPAHLVSTVGATHLSQPILFLQLVLHIPRITYLFYSWCLHDPLSSSLTGANSAVRTRAQATH
jgi:hypothetical protein